MTSTDNVDRDSWSQASPGAERGVILARLQERFRAALDGVGEPAAKRYGMSWALLVKHVDEVLLGRHDFRELIGNNPISVMTTNHACHANFIRAILQLRSPMCLIEVITWVYRSYMSRGFQPQYFPIELAAWKDAIIEHLAPKTDVSGLIAFYDALIDEHDSVLELARIPEDPVPVDSEYAPVVDKFLGALLAGDEATADETLRERIEAASQVPTWWVKVVTPSLQRIGRLWSEGKIGVAREHVATAIAQRVMTRNFPRLPWPEESRGTVAVVVAPGEQHDVGARMVCDCLELCGYRAIYTGANTPIESVVQMTVDQHIDALCISVTMPFHLDEVRALVQTIRDTHGDVPFRIIVGGQAFRADPELWQRMGADAYLVSADEIVAFLDREIAA